MHQLVPDFILQNLRANRLQGSLTAAALFIDISGFTRVTEALLGHGKFGAEVLASIMRTIFTPLVHSVYEQGGFVTGFAGDAISAIFPYNERLVDHRLRATAAAMRMQAHMAANAEQITRYGTFPFSAKIGLAAGQAHWGIPTHSQSERATYYFKGAPIEASAAAEQHGSAGETVADDSIYHAIRDHVTAAARDGFWLIRDMGDAAPAPLPVTVPRTDPALQARFFPRRLVEQDIDGEFRQVLNVFIGLQGDPTHNELVELMDHCFQLQEQYEGLLNRIDFGDKGCGLLLFWGAPISYENDLTRALDFLLALRTASTIPMRAGVTYRIAHAGYIGSPLAEEFTCYGRGVNLAARHMTSAAWSEIWLDEPVAQRAAAGYRIEALGTHQFKGFAAPQPVYQLVDRREEVHLIEERPFFGREQELAQLTTAFQPLQAGQFAGAIIVLGEAGIGKSRLVQAFLSPLTDSGQVQHFLCQTDEILRQSLNPFRAFLHQHFDQQRSRDETENKARFQERLQAICDDLEDVALREELLRTASFLGSLVGLYWPGSLYDQLDPELRYENTFASLKALFKAESLRHPTVIQLEDAHWLDQDSLAFLERLTRNMDGYPLVLLVTSRQELSGGALDPNAPQQTVVVPPLEDTVVTELAGSILDHEVSPALIRLLAERTEGNPFFVEQVLLYLQENDLLDVVAANASSALTNDLYIPTDVRAVLTARLDRLPPHVKHVVQNAAILGREFETPILAHMLNHDPQLGPALARAMSESLWYNIDEIRYLFRHALLRDAAYDMQVRSRRLQLHNLAALAFEAEPQKDAGHLPRHAAIAYHYDHAERFAEARHHYRAAADRAQGEYRNEDAITYYSRALSLTPSEEWEAQLALLKGRETVYHWLGLRKEQAADLDQMGRLLGTHSDPAQLMGLAIRKSIYAVVIGNFDEALQQAREALAYAQANEDQAAEAVARHRLGRTLWQQGNTSEAQAVLEQALQQAQTIRNRALEADCLQDLANTLRLTNQYETALSYLDRATAVFEELEDEQGQVRCLNMYGVIDYDLGRFTSSELHYQEALALCREIGWRFAESRVLLNLGNTRFDLGDHEKGRIYLEQAIALAAEIGDLRSQGTSLDTLGLITHYTGDPHTAVDLFAEAGTLLSTIDSRPEMAFALTHQGYAQLDTGDLQGARQSFESARALRQDLEQQALLVDTLAGLAALGLAERQYPEACDLALAVLSHIEQHGTEGIELPILVCLHGHTVLQACMAQDEAAAAGATRYLELGHALLTARMAPLENEAMRLRFLNNLPFNRALHDRWLAAQSQA